MKTHENVSETETHTTYLEELTIINFWKYTQWFDVSMPPKCIIFPSWTLWYVVYILNWACSQICPSRMCKWICMDSLNQIISMYPLFEDSVYGITQWVLDINLLQVINPFPLFYTLAVLTGFVLTMKRETLHFVINVFHSIACFP